MTDLKCYGVARRFDDKDMLTIRLNREPSDDELRKIHDAVRSALKPSDPDTKVVRLHDGQAQPPAGAGPVPSQGLIQALETTLEHARAGRLQCLWGSGFTHDGMRFVLKGGKHDNVYEMAGALAFLSDEYRDTVCAPKEG